MKKIKNILIKFIGVIGILAIFVVGFFLLSWIGSINFGINEQGEKVSLIEGIKDKYVHERINILLVGRGGGNHDAPDLTDTIIVVNIDTKKNIVSMLSIPRDMYVDYPNGSKGKINEIYVRFKNLYDSEDKGMQVLMDKVGDITGEKINYYMNIDFEGFKKVVDTIGGVEVTLDENFIDTKFPDGKLGYTTFMLKKGTWTLDGDVALKYVRSRHSTSDFDRSKRQQQVLSSLKNKVIEQGFLKNANNIKEFFEIYSSYMSTNIEATSVLKLSYFGKNSSDTKILTANLNTSCFFGSPDCSKGGFLYDPERKYFDGKAVSIPYGTNVATLSNYKNLHQFTDVIFNYPEVFIENYPINIFNSIKVNKLASTFSNDIIKFGFNIPKINSLGNTKKIFENSIIYYNGDLEDSVTLEVIKKFYTGKIEKTENPIYSKDPNTKIEIILGKDYKEVYNFKNLD